MKKTIIIKPIGSNADSFLKDPVGLAKGFKNSPFAKLAYDARVNNRRNLVAIELREPNVELMEVLLKVNKIGKWDITSYIPGSDARCYGVIGPIDKIVDLTEIKDIIETEQQLQVISVNRLDFFKGGKRQPSTAVKLEFKGTELPNKVYMGWG